MTTSCCSVAIVEATYLALLVAAFLAIAVVAAYAVTRLTSSRD
jgi:hypothetical protein